MDKPKKKDKIFINKNAGDVTKGIEMFNKSMTFNTQSSAQEELNQRVANNDISSEETYDILNHISELRDEAEKEDDHNNPIGAIKLHKEADKLQETKTKKTTIRECLNKMDLQASDDGFRGITLVDLYEACTLTKDDKNHLIKMLQTTDDAEKVREFLSNKCEFEDAPEDDIDSEVQLECTKSDWEELNDLDEGYQQGDEQVLDPDSEEYNKFEKIVDLLNEANIIYTSGRHKGERAYFYVDDVYLDFGSDWKWTTIVREDNVQVLSPADWLSIINEESTPEEIVNKIVTKDYSGVQFANESQLGEASYGGAYDIEDDQYFTREELNEFGEEVADTLTDLGNGKVDLLSIYIDDDVLEITVDWEGNEVTAEYRIDMRRIRRPKDLNKFIGIIIDEMHKELEDLGFNFHPNKKEVEEDMGKQPYSTVSKNNSEYPFSKEKLEKFGKEVAKGVSKSAHEDFKLKRAHFDDGRKLIRVILSNNGKDISAGLILPMRQTIRSDALDGFVKGFIDKFKQKLGISLIEDGDLDESKTMGESSSFERELRDKLVRMWFEEDEADWLVKNRPEEAEYLAYGSSVSTDDFIDTQRIVQRHLRNSK